MKTLQVLVALVLLTSCQSSNDSTLTVNPSLLYAKWNKFYYCDNQNNLVLNEDGTYIDLHSGNTCDSNANNTYQTTGTYTVKGNKIKFNTLTSEIVIVGENPPPTTQDFLLQTDLYVLKLTETQLEIGSKRSGTDFYDVVTYTKASE